MRGGRLMVATLLGVCLAACSGNSGGQPVTSLPPVSSAPPTPTATATSALPSASTGAPGTSTPTSSSSAISAQPIPSGGFPATEAGANALAKALPPVTVRAGQTNDLSVYRTLVLDTCPCYQKLQASIQAAIGKGQHFEGGDISKISTSSYIASGPTGASIALTYDEAAAIVVDGAGQTVAKALPVKGAVDLLTLYADHGSWHVENLTRVNPGTNK